MSPDHFCRVTPKMGTVRFWKEFSNRAITVDHGDGRKAFNRLVLRLIAALPSYVAPKHIVCRNEFVFIGDTLRVDRMPSTSLDRLCQRTKYGSVATSECGSLLAGFAQPFKITPKAMEAASHLVSMSPHFC